MICMLLEVAQLFGKSGLTVPVMLTERMRDALDYPDVVDFLQPVRIEGTLKNDGEIFVLSAKVHTQVAIQCDRCLTPVRKKIAFDLEERFSHTGKENEETETFSGDQIDLADFVKRDLIAALPMKVVCGDECKGLCPICGKDLNQGDCQCDTSHIDPRFESLRALFNVDEEV